MKIIVFFSMLLAWGYTIQKLLFDQTKYAVSSVTFNNAITQAPKMANQNYFYPTLSKSMSDAKYTLMIGISELDVIAASCRILVTRLQTSLQIYLAAYLNSNFKCSFMFFVADSSISTLKGSYNNYIGSLTIGVYDSTRQNSYLKSTIYHLLKPTNEDMMFGMVFTMVESFSVYQSPVSFSITSKLYNATHVQVNLGTGHNLGQLYLSFMYIYVWEINNYFQLVDGTPFSLTKNNSTYEWNSNPSVFLVIGLTGFSGSYPINFTSTFLSNCTLIPQTNQNQTLKFLRIQTVLQICPFGSKQINSTHCECLDRYYVFNLNSSNDLCYSCHYSCLTCTDKFYNSCVSCNLSDFRQFDNNRCLCNSGYYDINNQICAKCIDKCDVCIDSVSCEKCIQNNTLQNNKCVCKPGFIEQSPTNQTCIPCDIACSTCSIIPNNCTSCSSSKSRYLSASNCLCLDSFYEAGTDQCHQCSSVCLNCINSQVCTSCNDSQSRQLNGSNCSCKPGFYDSGTEVCEKCQPACFTCSSASVCLSCSQPRFLSSSSCLCPSGQYNQAGVSDCQKCSPKCQNCSSLSVCLGCIASQFRYLNKSDCVCQLGYYEAGTEECQKCQPLCSQCSSTQTCLKCYSSPFIVLINQACVCLNGSYFSQIASVSQPCSNESLTCGVCQACTSPCLTCSSASVCLSCSQTDGRALVDSACICPQGYFEEIGNTACKSCPAYCKTCSNSSVCLSCLTVAQHRLLNGSNCSCEPGYFDSGTEICQQCQPPCQTCLSTSVCLSCNDTQFRILSNSACICADRYYPQLVTVQCKPCPNLCLTCSSASVCLSCNPSQFRQLNGSNCICSAGHYDSGADLCSECQVPCRTCSSALACLSCNPSENRVLANSTCPCQDGYYNQQGTSACQQCALTCATCSDSSYCLSCKTTQFRFLKGSDCICQAGYYQQAGIQVCQACNKPCQTCSSNSLCLSCQEGAYILLEGKCFTSNTYPNIRIQKQNLNEVSASINFPIKITFQEDISKILYVYIDDVPTQIQIEQTNAESIIFRFNLTKPSQKLTTQFKNGSIIDTKTETVLFLERLSYDLQSIYYYSDSEVKLLTTVGAALEKTSEFVTYSRLGGVAFKLVNIFLDLIEYIHQISFYVFLDCDLPSNLKNVFSTLYNALQYNILPISVDIPGADYKDFNQPEVYAEQAFSFNFIANCSFLIIQLCLVTLTYIAIGKLSAISKSKSAFVKFFRSNFSKTIYSNSVQAFSACQLPLCFAGAVALIDRNFGHPMKVVNFTLGVVFVFVATFFSLINPIILYSLKPTKKINTEGCSLNNNQKHARFSEHYLFSKALLSFCVAVFIPLLPAKTAITVILCVCFFQVYFWRKTIFKNKFYCIIRIIYLSSNIIVHLLLAVLILCVEFTLQICIQIGYVIIFLIAFNIFLDLIQILGNLYQICSRFIKQLCFKDRKLTSFRYKSNRFNITMRRNIQLIRTQSIANKSNILFTFNQNDQNTQNINIVDCPSDNQQKNNQNKMAKGISLKKRPYQFDAIRKWKAKRQRKLLKKKDKLELQNIFDEKPPSSFLPKSTSRKPLNFKGKS